MDNTLDVLRYLESDGQVDINIPDGQDIEHDFQQHSDADAAVKHTPTVRLKRRTSGNCPARNKFLNAEAILLQPETPNKQNAKRTFDNSSLHADSHSPIRKHIRSGETQYP